MFKDSEHCIRAKLDEEFGPGFVPGFRVKYGRMELFREHFVEAEDLGIDAFAPDPNLWPLSLWRSASPEQPAFPNGQPANQALVEEFFAAWDGDEDSARRTPVRWSHASQCR